ncbi:YadA-like family protein [Pseudoxanthomonas beigongshangi]
MDTLVVDGELHVNSGRIGMGRQDDGSYSMAIGSESTLSANHGANSIAIGTSQTSGGDGAATTASGNRAIAIGSGARANSDNGIALGTNAVAAGTGSRQGSVAIGNQARADGDGSLALGATANAGGLLSTAIGHGSVATGTSSISIGGNARGTGAIALGGGTTQDDYAQAFGSGATALKRMAWAQGFNAAAKGQHSMALGAYSEASADYTLALGSSAKATGNGAWDGAGTALGAYSSAAAQGTAIGNAATAAGQGTAVGSYATAKGAGSMALGARAEASASNSVALGQGASATRDNAVSLGSETSRTGADGKTIAAFTRQLVNLSAGTQDTDAVNVGQLKPVINALGGGASFDAATGKVLAPVYRVRGGTQDNVGDALAALDAGIDAGKVHFVSIDGSDQEGNYNNDGATGKDSIAIGAGAQAKGRNDIHMGVGAGEGGVATNSNNVGVGTGAGARVKGEYNAALGAWAGQYVEGNYNAAVGLAGGQVKGDSNAAMGNSAGMLVTGNANSAIGAAAGALLTGHYNVASGTATGLGVQGNHNMASGSAAGMLVKGDGNVALGESAGTGYRIELDDVGMKITDRDGKVYTNFAELPAPKALNNTVAVGNHAITDADDAVAIGKDALSSHTGSVALGAGSIADGKTLAQEAYLVGGTAKGEVSIGDRRLTGVAAGATDTDAVNVAQLKQVVSSSTVDAVMYDSSAHDRITLGGVSASAPVALTNVKNGEISATSTDAINGSQIYTLDRFFRVNYTNGQPAAMAVGGSSLAIGAGAKSFASNSIAIGSYAETSDSLGGGGNIAVGASAAARGFNSMALGANASTFTDAANATAIGYSAKANSDSAVAIGSSAAAEQWAAVAIGDYAKAGGTRSVALGAGSIADGQKAVAMGDSATASGNLSTALGNASKADGGHAIAVGSGARGGADDALAVGHNARVTGKGGMALGTGAKSDQDDGVAIGRNATSSHAGSVALGEGSVADGGTLTREAYLVGGTARGEVNIGERRLTGLAAGAEDTDAVNVAQLKQVVASSTADAVVYDSAAHDRLTLGGVSASAPVALTNVKKGEVSATSTDAVNGAQLYEATQALEAGKGRYVSINDGGVARGNHDNDGATGEDAIAIGVDASASAKGATALGAGAVASAEGSVALGAGSVADQANTVSVGSAGNERRITHVADGVEDTDAANVGQLKKAGIVDPNGETRDVLTYDSGSNRSKVTLGGGAGGTVITNLAEGRVAIGSRDAVNGGQLAAIRDDLQNQIKNVDNRVTQIENNGTGGGQSPGFDADGSEDQPATAPNGSQGTASGAGAVASGNHSTANGAGAIASGNNSTALGAGSQATAENSVALGANSVADRANTVSVGSEGAPRQITNVAAGTAPTDAVNVAQLHDGLQEVKDWSRLYTDGRFDSLNRDINRVGQRADAGVASAMAMASLPQAYLPGANMAGAAISSFRGEASIAIGVSTISEDGRWVYKLNATGNTRGDVGAGMGVGLQW